MALPHDLSLDVGARYVDVLPNQRVPSYVACDARLGWQPSKTVEVAVVGSNLFDPRHPEFGTPASRKEVERSFYGKVTCRF
jgi:iron complex outermembrane receptor protein